jgi:leader peptidase (prepilin peptidase)/N-methyltransferase
LEPLPREAVVAIWSVFGLVVGSFLNVVIHRLPLEDESVMRPVRSRCPQCRHELTAWENVPVLSWILLRGRCRACRWPIPVRYPLVELVNAALWGLAGALAPSFPLAAIHAVVLSGLVVASAVDFDRFEIPDEVSIGGMVLAPIAALALPALHSDTRLAQILSDPHGPVSRLGSFSGCLAGMAVGAAILWGIGWAGSRLYGRDAMGFGDVKLLAAGGGFVGPGGVLWALMIASLVASVFGILNLLRFFLLLRARVRARGRQTPARKSLRTARIAGRYVPFGPYLALGIVVVLLYWRERRGPC